MFQCYQCNQKIASSENLSPFIGRRDACSHCGCDLHCCRNCSFYDRTAYNECREPQADRVLDKEKANFCDQFRLRSEETQPSKASSTETVLKKLDDLFK